MTAHVITVGAGKYENRGTRLELNSGNPAQALIDHFAGVTPDHVEAWWTPASFRGDVRKKELGESWCGVGVDGDYAGPDGAHGLAAPPDSEILAMERGVMEGEAPGNGWHPTPHGVRFLFILDAPTSDVSLWERAARGAHRMVADWLRQVVTMSERTPSGEKTAGFEIDDAGTEPQRIFWTPSTTDDKGLRREAKTLLIRETLYSIEELAALAPPESERKRAEPIGDRKIRHPGRHKALCSVAGTLRARGMGEAEIFAMLQAFNTEKCEPPYHEDHTRAIARDYAKREGASSPGGSEGPKAHLTATPCSQIEEKRVVWLWRGYVPRSALTLLEGPPKAGKSTALADIIACVTTGRPMPDGQPCENCGPVLLMSGEDPSAHVIVPRLRVAGADLSMVHIVKALDAENRPRQFIIGPDDIAMLEAQIAAKGAVLVAIDPLSIYMGRTDAHREQEVRQSLWHLSELAERTETAVACSRHHKKALTGDALTQGGGSVGFSAAARSILTVGRDPDDKTARVMAVGHCNYATVYPSLGFRLESVDGEDVARVVWTGVSKHDADDLVAVRIGPVGGPALQMAEKFLKDLLASGPVPAEKAHTAAETKGITRGTVDRAAASLEVVKKKDGLAGPWTWSLPSDGASKGGAA